jgi:ring-1,2-phenylacetyl-CoA epoxidase subunit PaaD
VVKAQTEEEIWSALATIEDPEIPVLTLVEMKIIRAVEVKGQRVRVVISPTFVGCPALDTMKAAVRERIVALGFTEVAIDVTFTPPWSTDMLEPGTLEKLRVYGVAPPPRIGDDLGESLARPVACPSCGSTDTRLQSMFGATLCKQLFVCARCKLPFERFKPI